MSDSPFAQEAHGELLRFLYTCPLGLLHVQADGVIEFLNGAATALLLPYSEDGSLANLYHFLERWDAGLVTRMKSLSERGGAVSDVWRVPFAVTGQPTQWIAFYARPFNDGLSVACYDDTTAVEQQEKLLRATENEAEQRARAELSASILHDMGNVLTGLGGQAVTMQGILDRSMLSAELGRLSDFLAGYDAALDRALGEPGKGRKFVEFVSALHETSVQVREDLGGALNAHCLYMSHAQEMLTINRAYASNHDLAGTSRVVDLHRLIADLRDMTALSFDKRAGTLAVELPPYLPPLRIDRSKLLLIVLNLIKNAQEAWDDQSGPPPLRVELVCSVTDDEELRVEIRDNGAGFEPERADSLFDPGFSTKGRNSGLGLDNCRKLIHSMGGNLELSSPGPGRGATATLILPSTFLQANEDSHDDQNQP